MTDIQHEASNQHKKYHDLTRIALFVAMVRPVSGGDRSIEVDLKPGVVAELTIKMQKKGTGVLGADDSVDKGQQ